MTTTETTSAAEAKPRTFDDLPLSDEVRRALAEMDYEIPTPVQTAVFESAAAGRDLVVQARTGTGKTTAFGLPIVDRLVSNKTKAVQALILCPTRELALQVSRELGRLSTHLAISITPIYGGAPIGRQIDQLDGGTQVVVGTPGRVLDHLRRGTMDPSKIRALVLDESDEMLSMGFERELTAIIERLPKSRQSLFFSATVPPDITRMAKSKLNDPEFVILSGDHVGALEIDHFIYNVTQDKNGALRQIIDIEDPESAIVFCNTRVQTEQLSNYLNREGYQAAWLNGDLPQSDREKVMRATREGKLRFLVATDVAARGIDISHLTHVINFDFPQDAEAYVHRTGRTGRAGKTGTAISLATPRDVGSVYILRLTYKIRPVERSLPSEREQRTRQEADIVNALADTFRTHGRSLEHRSLARRLLSHDDAESVVAGMLAMHLSSNPELPEMAESRRRGRTPEPVAEEREAPKRGRRGSRRSRSDDEAPQTKEAKPAAKRPAKKDDDAKAKGAKKDDAPAKAKAAKTDEAPAKAKTEEPKAEPRKNAEVADDGDKPKRRRRRGRRSKDESPDEASAQAAAQASADDEEPPKKARKSKKSAKSDGDEAERKPRRSRRGSKTAPEADEGKKEPAKASSKKAPAKKDAPKAAKKDAPKKEAAKKAKPAPKKAKPAPVAEEKLAPGLAELQLDIGKKDGAKVRVIKSLLADAGITPDQVHRLRVRDSHCLVQVDDTVAESALEVLDGADLGDRKLKATIAQRST